MSMITFQTASTPEQIKEIAALAKEIWTEHYTPLIGAGQTAYMVEKFQSEAAIRHAIKQEHYRYDTALDNGKLIGYCGLCPQEKELFLSKLYVHKDYRGLGVAKVFVHQAKGMARVYQLPSIYLTVNKHNDGSIAAYRKLGFVVADEVVSPIGNGFVMDDYIMRLSNLND